MGTPDFIAAEALVAGIVVDHRADLNAVGVMVYQMLAGKAPRGYFRAPSVLVPELDRRFDAIVARAMEQEWEQRYQDAADIRRDLDAILTTPVAKEQPRQPVRLKPVMCGPGQVPLRNDGTRAVAGGGKAPDDRNVVPPKSTTSIILVAVGALDGNVAPTAPFARSALARRDP